MKTVFVIFVVILIGILLTGCGKGIGDSVTARNWVDLSDGDQISCTLEKGQIVQITRIDYKDFGDSEIWKMLWVQDPNNASCWGRARSTNFK